MTSVAGQRMGSVAGGLTGAGAAEVRGASALARLRRGEPDAIAEIVELVYTSLLATATRLVGEGEDAPEVVRSALVDGLGDIEPSADWEQVRERLRRLVVRGCLSRLRARGAAGGGRRVRRLDDLLPRFDACGARITDWPSTPGPGVSARRARVRAMLDELPTPCREIMILCEIERFRAREVAGMLDLAPAAVAAGLRHGRQALCALVTREGP